MEIDLSFPNIHPATRNRYTKEVRRLENIFERPISYILQYPDYYFPKLDYIYSNPLTKVGYLSTILGTLKHNPDFRDQYIDAYCEWLNIQKDIGIKRRLYSKEINGVV